MKKILLFAAAMALATACVDNDFDLSDVKTDDIGIGNKDSEFTIPLATIDVKWSAISSTDTYDSLENIFAEADTWVPLSMNKLMLSQLNTESKDYNPKYVDEIIDGLLNDIESDATKRTEVINMIVASSSYAASIKASMPKNPQTGEPLFSIEEYISEHFSEFRNDSRAALQEIVNNHLESLTNCVKEITRDVDGFEIDDDIIDALTGQGDISIYGTMRSHMPIDCQGALVLAAVGDEDGFINIPLDLNYEENKDYVITVDNDALHNMNNDNLELRVKFEPTIYYPRLKDDKGNSVIPETDNDKNTKSALTMVLKLRKKGGFSLGDLFGGGDVE